MPKTHSGANAKKWSPGVAQPESDRSGGEAPEVLSRAPHLKVLIGGKADEHLTPVEGGEVCLEPTCEHMATTAAYCRAHYIKNWSRIKQKEAILKSGQLERFIADLVERYSLPVLKAIRHDLEDEDAFERVRLDLGLHEGIDELSSGDTGAIDEAEIFESVKPEEITSGEEEEAG